MLVIVLQQLLGCEGVDLVFTPEAIKEIAAMAEQINKEVGVTCSYKPAGLQSVNQCPAALAALLGV